MVKSNLSNLPKEFEAFHIYAEWSLSKESERRRRRFRVVSYDEIKSFYDFCHEKTDSGKSRVEDALIYLDQFQLNNMPEAESRLFNILLSFAEITSTVEAWGETNPSTITPYEIFTTHPDNDIQR